MAVSKASKGGRGSSSEEELELETRNDINFGSDSFPERTNSNVLSPSERKFLMAFKRPGPNTKSKEDMETHPLPFQMKGHGYGDILSAAFSATLLDEQEGFSLACSEDGAMIAVGCKNGQIQIFRGTTLEHLQTIDLTKAHGGGPDFGYVSTSLTFLPVPDAQYYPSSRHGHGHEHGHEDSWHGNNHSHGGSHGGGHHSRDMHHDLFSPVRSSDGGFGSAAHHSPSLDRFSYDGARRAGDHSYHGPEQLDQDHPERGAPEVDHEYEMFRNGSYKYALLVAQNERWCIVHPATDAVLASYREPGNTIRSVAFRPDGMCFATAGEDKIVRVYALASHVHHRHHHRRRHPDSHVQRSPLISHSPLLHSPLRQSDAGGGSKNLLGFGAFKPTAEAFHLPMEGHRPAPHQHQEHPRRATAPSSTDPFPGDRSGGEDSDHAVTTSDVVKRGPNGPWQLVRSLEHGDGIETFGHSGPIFALSWKPDDPNMLVSGGWDKSLQVWDVRKGRSARALHGPYVCGEALAVAGNMALAGSWRNDDPLQLWDLASGSLLTNLPWPQHHHDGCLIYAAGIAFPPHAAAGDGAQGGLGGQSLSCESSTVNQRHSLRDSDSCGSLSSSSAGREREKKVGPSPLAPVEMAATTTAPTRGARHPPHPITRSHRAIAFAGGSGSSPVTRIYSVGGPGDVRVLGALPSPDRRPVHAIAPLARRGASVAAEASQLDSPLLRARSAESSATFLPLGGAKQPQPRNATGAQHHQGSVGVSLAILTNRSVHLLDL